MNTAPHIQTTKPSRLRVVPLAIWSSAVFVVIAATILMANEHKNFKFLAEFVLGPPSAGYPEHPPEAPPQSLGASSDRPLLLEVPATDTVPFVRLARAEDRCRTLTQSTQEMPVYRDADRFSQCTLLYRDGESIRAPSVFIQIQTDQAGMVTRFRLKFNTEGRTAEKLVTKGLELLKLFGGFFLKTEDFIAVLNERIQLWENFQVILGPYVVEMNREVIDPTRFNLFGRLYNVNTLLDDPWRAAQGTTFRE